MNLNNLLTLEPKNMEGIPNHRIILSCNDEDYWYRLWMLPLSPVYFRPIYTRWNTIIPFTQEPLNIDLDCPGC